MRLQKFLARAGVASRRHAEALIAEGRVTVNGAVMSEMGAKVTPGVDAVAVDGELVVLPAETVTLMLHKPAGYVTTMSDPQGRPTVAELVDGAACPGLFPVGRLDADTTGLLLFTTDGELGQLLLHPRHHVTKTYLALVEGALEEADAARLRAGIELEDGPTLPADVSILRGADARRAAALIGDDAQASGTRQRHGGKRSRTALEGAGTYVEVGLREGRKRQVRRMLEAVGHPIIALHRQSLGPLDLGELDRGAFRILTEQEVGALKSAS
ncbi:pseudouridine synthase [Adlercreutzia sp. R25]|uniref:Pseudouridine synthase n=1 Tax=Adlercreutzia shanghongiae TaxID=3111773 RepID=A0ABU6IY07_9ACTN|nr:MULTISPECIES: pseudouridine synthase [unclassified Adlercreutzia]MEC4272502.1 pseudouridine synthase [Adlercreutzia sp. R25]MEC4294598.1 pseudouridine synthase [Adlercreutzia sp. R22]